MKEKVLFFACFLLIAANSVSQNVRDSSLFAPMVGLSYSFQLPGGDLVQRFGYNHSIGASFTIKDKKRWVYGLGGTYLYGYQVKENTVLDSIAAKDGFIIDQNGTPASVSFVETGFTVSARVGKLFNIWTPNKNSGLLVTMDIGFLEHKIRIQSQGNQSPQLYDNYLKGYDRLTSGLMIMESVGYLYLGNKRMLNFYGGFEFLQAFTQNRRYNFDQMKMDDTKRLDLLFGARVGWILPLYKRVPKELYFY